MVVRREARGNTQAGGISMSTKQAVLDLLEKLPEDCTIDDIQYHLYVLQTIERGRREIAQGKKLSHEDVKRELRAKWQSSAK
jgi:hypothetical protein